MSADLSCAYGVGGKIISLIENQIQEEAKRLGASMCVDTAHAIAGPCEAAQSLEAQNPGDAAV